MGFQQSCNRPSKLILDFEAVFKKQHGLKEIVLITVVNAVGNIECIRKLN
jgi:hypothetical protein